MVYYIDFEDQDLCPPEHALDEYHPKATKTLFVGNLCSATVTQDELRKTFRVYGEIIVGLFFLISFQTRRLIQKYKQINQGLLTPLFNIVI